MSKSGFFTVCAVVEEGTSTGSEVKIKQYRQVDCNIGLKLGGNKQRFSAIELTLTPPSVTRDVPA